MAARRVKADADRPHPGPLRPHHLQARHPRMPRLRCAGGLEEPARAATRRSPRAGAGRADGLPDHLDDGRRGAGRHRDRAARKSASRSPARPAPRTRQRISGSSAFRRISWSVSMSATTSRAASAATRRRVIPPAPIARDFMKLALADKPAIPFKIPAGIKLVRVDAKTGMRAGPGDSGKTILEAFKPGTAPSDNYSAIGVADADGRTLTCRRTRIAACSGPGPAGCIEAAGPHMRHCALPRRPLHPSHHRNSGICRGSETPCAPKSNASLKRSSSQSGC